MRNAIAFGALIVAAGTAAASDFDARAIDGKNITNFSTSFSADRNTPLYSNLAGSGSAFGWNEGALFADDMVIGDTGIVDEITFSIVNFTEDPGNPLNPLDPGTQYTLNGGTASIEFWTLNGAGDGIDTQLLDIDVDLAGIDLGFGFGGTLTIDGLSGLGFGLNSGDLIIAGVRYENLTFDEGVPASGANVGQLLAGDPPAVGSSQDLVFLEGFGFASFTSSFGNTVFEIATPAPGAMALLGLGGLAAARRRR